MIDTVMSKRTRLERHSRRDGLLQSRARPNALQGKEEDDVSYIRRFVEEQERESNFSKRLFFGNSGNAATPADGSTGTGTGTGSDTGTGADTGTGTGTDSGTGAGTGNNSGAGNGASNGNSGANNGNGNGNGNAGNGGNIFTSTRFTYTIGPGTTLMRSSTAAPSTTALAATTTSLTTRTRSSTSAASIATSATLEDVAATTTVAFVGSTPTQSLDTAALSSSTTKPASSGPGAGPIIGIVAGALAGIAVLVVIVGFLVKKLGKKEDPYESDPFDRDEFRRNSAMLPETFESDDGHPGMAEYPNNMHSVGGYGNDAGYAGAGAAMVGGGMVASSSYNQYNENHGGPRPPSMFQKHINGPGAQYNMAEAPPMPQVGAIYGAGYDPTPSLPPMALGGSDPYSIAGVGRNHQMDGNINNPYAHLDRSPSASGTPQYNPYEQQENGYSDLNRNGSQGSQQYQQHSNENYHESNGQGYDTAGRPGTSEGRSGTPDLPNVQQTYAMSGGAGGEQHHQYSEGNRVTSPHHMMSSQQDMHQDHYSNQGHNASSQQPLQIRNLLPNPHGQQQQQQPQRPLSGDENAAYGGVW